MKKQHLLTLIIAFLLTACNSTSNSTTNPSASTRGGKMESSMGMDMMDESMMARHMAPIPAEYRGLSNPIPAEADSLERGQKIYTTYCQSCHGETGMGEGPAGTTTNPPAAPIAHTAQMVGDDYLFWRISEGGVIDPFNSVMPPWKAVLAEEDIWDVINYTRYLNQKP